MVLPASWLLLAISRSDRLLSFLEARLLDPKKRVIGRNHPRVQTCAHVVSRGAMAWFPDQVVILGWIEEQII